MNIQTLAATTVALMGLTVVATAQTANSPASAASADSRANVGAVHGVPPTPATASSPTTPKLVRHTPGKGTVTQPVSGASAAVGASTPAGSK